MDEKKRKKQKCPSSALPLFKGQWRYHHWQAADMINCNLTLFLFCPTTTIEPGQSSGGSGGQINGSAASLLSGGKAERIDPPRRRLPPLPARGASPLGAADWPAQISLRGQRVQMIIRGKHAGPRSPSLCRALR